MKNENKPKYYFLVIFIGTVLVMGLLLVISYLEGTLKTDQIWVYAVTPFLFTGIYWGGDVLLRKIRKRKVKVDYEQLFLDAIGQRMRDADAFLVEDYRHLQDSQRFQDSLKTAYLISQNGEDSEARLERLEKKFEKRTVEYRAMQYVTAFVREKLAEKSQ